MIAGPARLCHGRGYSGGIKNQNVEKHYEPVKSGTKVSKCRYFSINQVAESFQGIYHGKYCIGGQVGKSAWRGDIYASSIFKPEKLQQ